MRRIDLRILIGVAVGAVVLVAAVLVLRADDDDDVEEGAPVPRSEFYGVNATELRTYATPELSETLDEHAREISERGIGWARFPISQGVEEPLPGSADWSVPDRIVAALARQGVRAQPVFVGTAAWAAAPEDVEACGPFAAPRDLEAWSRLVAGAVRRYGPSGSFWGENPEIPRLPVTAFEVGNEPNSKFFWCPAADPERYAALYRAALDASLAVDPEARLIVGGLSPALLGALPGSVTVSEFLRRMLAADPSLAGRIPAVAIHPYGVDAADSLLRVRLFRQAMQEAGLGEVPMLINETGWYTQGPSGDRRASEGDRAERISELAAVIDETDCGLEGFGVHAWSTAERDGANPEDWYGIADPASGAPHESAIAYGRAIGDRQPAEGALAPTASSLCG